MAGNNNSEKIDRVLELVFDIKASMVKVETRLDSIETAGKVTEINTNRRIVDIEDNLKWANRTIIGMAVTLMISLTSFILQFISK